MGNESNYKTRVKPNKMNFKTGITDVLTTGDLTKPLHEIQKKLKQQLESKFSEPAPGIEDANTRLPESYTRLPTTTKRHLDSKIDYLYDLQQLEYSNLKHQTAQAPLQKGDSVTVCDPHRLSGLKGTLRDWKSSPKIPVYNFQWCDANDQWSDYPDEVQIALRTLHHNWETVSGTPVYTYTAMNNHVYEVNLETKKQKNVTYNTERPVRFKAFLPEPGTCTNGGLWKVTFEKEGQEVLFQELGWEDETTRELRKVNLKRTQGSQAAQTSLQKGVSVTICGLTDTANIHINGLSGTLDEFYEGHGSQPKGLWCRVILDNGQTIDVRPACLRHTPEFGDAGFYQNRAYLKDEYKAYVASTDTSDFLKMMFEKAKALPEWLTDHVDIIPPDFIKYLTLCQLNKDDIDRVRQNYEKLQSENCDRKIEVKLVCHGVCDTSTVAGATKARTIRTHGFLRKFNNAGRSAWGPGIYVDERVRGTVGLYGKCGATIHFS